MTNTLRHFLLPLAMTGVATLLALPLASCNIVTPIAYAIEGPGQIDAEYTLPDKKTVVFVDDPENILPRTSLRTTIGDAVSFDLMGRELLGSTVATRDAIAVSRSGSGGDAGRLMSIEAIGRALDASQIIHIQPTIFDLAGRTDSQGLRPTAKATVKVIDLDLRQRTYPATSMLPGGREIVATIREADPTILRTRAGRSELEEQLSARLAVQIARLFYQHDRVDLGENLGTRKQ
ncbi:MAG: hypothetical protein RL136_584 [Planctomycetota bacterium]|jgi:hypothetical protein